jgi:hypothetical protein
MSEGIDILAVEDTSEDNGFDWVSGALSLGELDVTSVRDMAIKVIARAGAAKIRSLYVVGHASPGNQSVGAGKIADATGMRSLVLDPATGKLAGAGEGELARLRGRFAPKAVVTLGGCEVAKGPGGIALLRRISAVLGDVRVQGGDRLQRLLPGMEGNVIRCLGAVCWVQSAAWW